MQKAGQEQKFSTDYSNDERATSMELDVLLQNRVSGIFRDGVATHELDTMLSTLCSEPSGIVGDGERLQCFRGLKALADPPYLDKFKLILVSDRTGNTWRYEFSLGDRHHYASEALLIGDGQDLNDYESEYFLQAFPSTINPEEINTAIRAVCYGVGDETPSNSQRLQRFQALATFVPLEKAGLFESNVSLDNDNKKWTYQFLIDGVRLYGSEPIELDDVNDLALFQNAILLQRFHKLAREADWSPDVLVELAGLREKLLPIQTPAFGVQVYLAAKFESMASIACAFHKEAFIDVHGPIFCLKMDGAELYDGQIPPAAPGNDMVTPRVQITMSALRVSILSLKPAYTTLMSELDNYRLGSQGLGATDELSLRDALNNDNDDIREIRTRRLNGPEGTSLSYELEVTFESEKKGTFSRYENGMKDTTTLIAAFSKLSSDSHAFAASTALCGKKLLRGLFLPVRIQVYLESLLFMSQKESLALHEEMRNTVFLNDVSLGEIFNIPARKPS